MIGNSLKHIILTCTTLFLSANAFGQEVVMYDVDGAKIGQKIGNQIGYTEMEREHVTLGVQTPYGVEFHHRKGLTSFVGAMDGMVMGSLAYSYKYQNYYHGEVNFNYRKPKNISTDISAIEVTNITYADDNNDGCLSKDEFGQIYFDIINTGDKPLFGIVPVLLANKTKHVLIAKPLSIDTLQAHSALRYVIELSGDGERDPGKVDLLLRVRYGDNQHWDVGQIILGIKRKKK